MVDEAGGAEPLRQPRWWRRRSVLIAGASGLALSGFGVTAANDLLPDGLRAPNMLGSANSPDVGYNKVERVYSAARGQEVTLRTILPSRNPPPGIPVSLLLHGLHGSATGTGISGLGSTLVDRVARGDIPPFAFVAVDGGDNYWHSDHKGDDPLAMLLEEVPVWLRERGLGGLDGQPAACAGVSMGGFGALLYGRRRRERFNQLAAVATISPALITSWRVMSKRKAFRDVNEWAALDPLRNPHALGSTPTGMWCGDEDHFITGVRKYAAMTNPEVVDIRPGKHGGTFFSSTVPGVLSFLGRHMPDIR